MNLEFDLETQLAAAGMLFGIIAIMFSLFSVPKYRRAAESTGLLANQIADLEQVIARQKEFSETNSQRVTEQSRRIAWLESRVRQPKLAGEEILDDVVQLETPKLNMTERRHRVISLATRGQNIESIANALGMLTGEVELIVDMNQAAINHK